MLKKQYWLFAFACLAFSVAIPARSQSTISNDLPLVPKFEIEVLVLDEGSNLPLQGVKVKASKGWRRQWEGEGITDKSGAATIAGDGEGFYFIKLSEGGIVPESVALDLTEFSRTVIVPCIVGTEVEVKGFPGSSIAELYWLRGGKWELYIRAGQRWRAEFGLGEPVRYGPVPPGDYGVLILGEDHGRNSKFFADWWIPSRQIIAQVEPFPIHAGSPQRVVVEPSVKGFSIEHSFKMTGFDGERSPANVVWGRTQLPKGYTWNFEGNQLNISGLPFCGILAEIDVKGHGHRRLFVRPIAGNEEGHSQEILVNKCEWQKIEVVGNDDQFVPSLIDYSLEDGFNQLGEDNYEFCSGQTQLFLPKNIASFSVVAYPSTGRFTFHSVPIEECEPIEGGWRIRIPLISNGMEEDALGFAVIERVDRITFVTMAREFTVSFLDSNGRLMYAAKRDPKVKGSHGNSIRVPKPWKDGPGRRLLSQTRFNEVIWTGLPVGAKIVRIAVGDGRSLRLPISCLKVGVVNTIFLPSEGE